MSSYSVSERPKTAVIIPVYNCKGQVHLVFERFPFELVDMIVIVDDRCPINTGDFAQELANKSNTNDNCKVVLVKNEINLGVGGAVKEGIRCVRKNNPEIDYVLKMDGDGQMDPQELKLFLKCATETNADYIKGNRFTNMALLQKMPKLRLAGNAILSFIMKIATGNYTIMDPTCGYLMMRISIFDQVDMDRIQNRFFFESHLLGEVTLRKLSVAQVPVRTIYGDEQSNLNITKILFEFPLRISRLFLKRMLYQYFLYSFSFGSIALLIGIPLFIFSILFGGYHWIMSITTNHTASAGTVMLSGLSFLIAIQCAIIFFSEDIKNKKPAV